MINVKHYLNDGMNWQAQMVLAYIRSHTEMAIRETWNDEFKEYEINILVGPYENCREKGYVFTICGFALGKLVQKNYAVYEHRNWDGLCLLISNTYTTNTPNVEEMWKDKGEDAKSTDYDMSWDCGDVIECGEYILNDMANTIKEWKEKN